jgi:hypothetical protein
MATICESYKNKHTFSQLVFKVFNEFYLIYEVKVLDLFYLPVIVSRLGFSL